MSSNNITTKPKRKVNYLNNKDLLAQVILSKEQGKMTDELAKMLQTLCLRYGKKSNFSGYSYNDDMQAYAMFMLVRTWNSFDPAKSSNPFAFFTQCVKNSFRQYLHKEKRQRDIRDMLLVDEGMNPSNTFISNYEDERRLHQEANRVFAADEENDEFSDIVDSDSDISDNTN
jgi:DNA-directed RNA polymerase specialized sigma24 family protein